MRYRVQRVRVFWRPSIREVRIRPRIRQLRSFNALKQADGAHQILLSWG
jgi:hypothetical protein